ncbi:MAG TPA: PIN domain-containing protein, partial [Edaphobacter sp.]|nr:PIN domain-containing protein [Edaphobacter sp.]
DAATGEAGVLTTIYLLDTNTFGYIARHRSEAVRDRLRALQHNEIAAISAITEAECYYGLAKRRGATVLQRAVQGLLDQMHALPWGSNEAKVYGELRAKLESQGRTLSNLDMLIAAHAVAVDAVLVTNDRAFHQVEGLRAIENWATDLV